MKPQLAYDAIALEYGGNTVLLRPSLRAATQLEKLHGGFPDLLRKIEEFDTQTVRHVVNASCDAAKANDLFAQAAKAPLFTFERAVQQPLHDLVFACLPKAKTEEKSQPDNTQPVPWAEVFQSLYEHATGWLGWPPESAWNATPQEIVDAMDGFISMHNAIHGSADEETGPTPKQHIENEALGLDPEFDRAGLQALKELSRQREGMHI